MAESIGWISRKSHGAVEVTGTTAAAAVSPRLYRLGHSFRLDLARLGEPPPAVNQKVDLTPAELRLESALALDLLQGQQNRFTYCPRNCGRQFAPN